MRARRTLGLVALSLALTGFVGAGTAVAAEKNDPGRNHRYTDLEDCIRGGGQPVLERDAEVGVCYGGDENGEIVIVDRDYDDYGFDNDFDNKGQKRS
ncbi:hypothetical protein [Streptomyces thermolineatus]|uniref:hypothetical protein n=1 Tax=Streptomyces thermolineatus TaxID=44033 RepID=UPI00384B23A9